MTPEEYRLFRARRASAQPPIAERKCASCGLAATLTGSTLCGPCSLIAVVLGRPGVKLPE